MQKMYWKGLALAGMAALLFSWNASAAETEILDGNGVQVAFDHATGKVRLYRTEENHTLLPMSKPSFISYPIIDGNPVSDFTDFVCEIKEDYEGTAGTGKQMTITSYSPSAGLERTCRLETVDDVPGLLYIQTSYQAQEETEIQTFVDCSFALDHPSQTVWSYNGGGEGQQSYYDTLQKIDLTDSQAFHRDNRQDDTSVGIPVADIYCADGGFAIGDASAVRRELQTPVTEADQTVSACIRRPSRTLPSQESVSCGEGFVHVHTGDYYLGLRGYADGMKQLGFETLSKEDIPESSYDLR